MDQLTIWSERAGVDIVKQEMGSDPASVVYDAVQAAVDHFEPVKDPDLDTILEYDTLARQYVRENF